MNRNTILTLVLLLPTVACDDDKNDAMTAGGTEATAGDDSAGDDSSAADSSGGEPTVDADAIAEQAIAFNTLEKVNDEPVSSQHGLANTMNLWVNADALAAYESLGEGTTFDEATYILKEQLNGDGTLNSIAVMYKGPEGYAPDAGGWWFGLVNPDGGVGLGGQPEACVGCHADVSMQDWAWGLPAGE